MGRTLFPPSAKLRMPRRQGLAGASIPAAALDEMEGEHDHRDHEDQVDERADDPGNQAANPKDDQEDCNSDKHVENLLKVFPRKTPPAIDTREAADRTADVSRHEPNPSTGPPADHGAKVESDENAELHAKEGGRSNQMPMLERVTAIRLTTWVSSGCEFSKPSTEAVSPLSASSSRSGS